MKLGRAQAQPAKEAPLQVSERKTKTGLLKDELVHRETRTGESRANPLVRLRRETTPRGLLSLTKVLKNVKGFLRTSREARCNRRRSNSHPFFERNWGGFDDGDTL